MSNTESTANPADEVLRLDRQLCFPLYAASNILTRAYRPLLDELGLTYPQYLVLLVLWERAPRAVGEIGQQLFLDTGTLTPLLKRMEAAGLVNRQRDAEDERRVIVSLTPKGDALRVQARSVPERMVTAPCLTLAEAQNLHETVWKLIRGLQPGT
ncbi:MarR family winged helix-turn-helix transcriptional regulator [Novosphingobium olei]|uniref:MarR family transcriptional regulator n=1 Tax=Novosphingobium olei TaxID=2728851 RepID=A0A7Y0BMR5_9SPHN|nr:MarR family transcriptional regulator [Novosphingobium olei]NML93225.1 MarR family transcriptional regulator [Novosphingobium olei]